MTTKNSKKQGNKGSTILCQMVEALLLSLKALDKQLKNLIRLVRFTKIICSLIAARHLKAEFTPLISSTDPKASQTVLVLSPTM